MDPTDEVLADLQERVRVLEARLGPAGEAGPAPAPGAAPGTFWLLEALRERGLRGAEAFGGTAADAEGSPVSWQIIRLAEDLTSADWAASVPALAALGHPSRMQILQLVATGQARTAAELARADGLGTTGQIYHHLRQLVTGGWRPPARAASTRCRPSGWSRSWWSWPRRRVPERRRPWGRRRPSRARPVVGLRRTRASPEARPPTCGPRAPRSSVLRPTVDPPSSTGTGWRS